MIWYLHGPLFWLGFWWALKCYVGVKKNIELVLLREIIVLLYYIIYIIFCCIYYFIIIYWSISGILQHFSQLGSSGYISIGVEKTRETLFLTHFRLGRTSLYLKLYINLVTDMNSILLGWFMGIVELKEIFQVPF